MPSIDQLDVGGLAIDRGKVRLIPKLTPQARRASVRWHLRHGRRPTPITTLLDLGDRALVIDYGAADGSPQSAVRGWILNAIANNGRGIIASRMLLDNNTAVGYGEAG
ncbi:MAG: hypothetical protein QM751_07615 [Paludibacteraceae bacterium]